MDAIRYGITSIKRPEKRGVHVYRKPQIKRDNLIKDLKESGVKIIRPNTAKLYIVNKI